MQWETFRSGVIPVQGLTSTHYNEDLEVSPIEGKHKIALTWLDEGSAISRKFQQEQETYRHAIKRSAFTDERVDQVRWQA